MEWPPPRATAWLWGVCVGEEGPPRSGPFVVWSYKRGNIKRFYNFWWDNAYTLRVGLLSRDVYPTFICVVHSQEAVPVKDAGGQVG